MVRESVALRVGMKELKMVVNLDLLLVVETVGYWDDEMVQPTADL